MVTPDANGGFTGSFGVTGGSLSFTPAVLRRCPATELAENQEVNGEVSETGQVQVEAPSVMSPADQQQLNATAEQAVEASDDTSVAEASNAAAETTQQVQSEVDNGAPAEPADPPASDPAEEPEPAPEPEPTPEPESTPSPEDATDTQPAAEPAVEADSSVILVPSTQTFQSRQVVTLSDILLIGLDGSLLSEFSV